MLGHISFWNNIKGYGFITVTRVENGATFLEQYFFHHSNFLNKETPALNGIVVFHLGQPIKERKKAQAIHIRYATPEEISAANKQLTDAKNRMSIAELLSGGVQQ
jgi:cold shock CspA family protein